MKYLIIIAALMFASCKKEETPQPTAVEQPTPKPIVCDKYHYGDSCKKMYIDHYIGTYTMVANCIFTQVLPSKYEAYHIDTYLVWIKRDWDGIYLQNIFNDNTWLKVSATDSTSGFEISSLPSYNGIPTVLKDLKFKKVGKDYVLTGESSYSDGVQATISKISFKMTKW